MKRNIIICCCFFIHFVLIDVNAQQVEKSTYGAFALTNATVETVTKGRLENATVIIRNGMIEAVGPGISIPPDAQVIECKPSQASRPRRKEQKNRLQSNSTAKMPRNGTEPFAG